MTRGPEGARPALSQLPRPVFISYASRDFRIAYQIWRQMLSGEDHDKAVLMDFPPLVRPDMELEGLQATVSDAGHPLAMGRGFAEGWAPGMPGWMVGIGGNLIRANSLVVVLTPNAARSSAVAKELQAFGAFPDKPVGLLSVNRTPIPEAFTKLRGATVYDVLIDIEAMLSPVLSAAREAEREEKWRDAGILFTDAINLIPLMDSPDGELQAEALIARGRMDLKLGFNDEAVRVLEQADRLLAWLAEQGRPARLALASGCAAFLGLARAARERARHDEAE
jgi:hypothetical protein